MINYLKKKLSGAKLRNTRRDFGYEIKSFDLKNYGEIEYAKWLNPFAYSIEFPLAKVEFFKQFIEEGTLAIDIGANTGDTGVPMALAAGAQGAVIALEPNPKTFKILKKNAELNKDKYKIIPLNFAATAEDGTFYYTSSEATFNNGGLSKNKRRFAGKYALKTKIKGLNLENYLRKNEGNMLSKLSCIKVDTEGMDIEIIESITGIIKEFKPAVLFEVHHSLDQSKRSLLYDFFWENGYHVYQFEEFLIDAPKQKLDSEDMMKWKHFEAYAIQAN